MASCMAHGLLSGCCHLTAATAGAWPCPRRPRRETMVRAAVGVGVNWSTGRLARAGCGMVVLTALSSSARCDRHSRDLRHAHLHHSCVTAGCLPVSAPASCLVVHCRAGLTADPHPSHLCPPPTHHALLPYHGGSTGLQLVALTRSNGLYVVHDRACAATALCFRVREWHGALPHQRPRHRYQR